MLAHVRRCDVLVLVLVAVFRMLAAIHFFFLALLQLVAPEKALQISATDGHDLTPLRNETHRWTMCSYVFRFNPRRKLSDVQTPFMQATAMVQQEFFVHFADLLRRTKGINNRDRAQGVVATGFSTAL